MLPHPRPPSPAACNHCLYNHSRSELNRRLGISDFQRGVVPHSYYAFQPVPGWRVLCLDGYDVSILGWPQGEELFWFALCGCAAVGMLASSGLAAG